MRNVYVLLSLLLVAILSINCVKINDSSGESINKDVEFISIKGEGIGVLVIQESEVKELYILQDSLVNLSGYYSEMEVTYSKSELSVSNNEMKRVLGTDLDSKAENSYKGYGLVQIMFEESVKYDLLKRKISDSGSLYDGIGEAIGVPLDQWERGMWIIHQKP